MTDEALRASIAEALGQIGAHRLLLILLLKEFAGDDPEATFKRLSESASDAFAHVRPESAPYAMRISETGTAEIDQIILMARQLLQREQ